MIKQATKATGIIVSACKNTYLSSDIVHQYLEQCHPFYIPPSVFFSPAFYIEVIQSNYYFTKYITGHSFSCSYKAKRFILEIILNYIQCGLYILQPSESQKMGLSHLYLTINVRKQNQKDWMHTQ